MNIGIFYIGLSRFRESTKENHQQFFNQLENKFQCSYYDFTNLDRSTCPFNLENLNQRGNLQVWDFAKATNLIQNNIVIKMRTDVWITDSASNEIILEIFKVCNNEIDASFLGFSTKIFQHTVLKVDHQGVADFIVIANKKKIRSFEDICNHLSTKNYKSGNLAYSEILNNHYTANNVVSELYIVRKESKVEYQIGLDFIMSIPVSKRNKTLSWYLSSRS